jgi:hypothetical protein
MEFSFRPGFERGVKMGFTLGFLYNLLTPVWVMSWPDPTFNSHIGIGLMLWLTGIVMGVLPATLLGGFMGAILSSILSLPQITPLPRVRMARGIGVSFITLLLIHGIALEWNLRNTWNPVYQFLLVGPSFFFLGAAGWFSATFSYKKATTNEQ